MTQARKVVFQYILGEEYQRMQAVIRWPKSGLISRELRIGRITERTKHVYLEVIPIRNYYECSDFGKTNRREKCVDS